MSQFGWGLVVSQLMSEDPDWVPAYRWDKEGSPYYLLRPDRVLLGMAYLTEPRVRIHYDIRKTQEFLASRGGGGPSVMTQPPPSSSKSRPQARASGRPVASTKPGRKSCPKGHYWSYTEKKCLKSKFR